MFAILLDPDITLINFQIKDLMFCTFLWDDEKIMGVDENIGNTVMV